MEVLFLDRACGVLLSISSLPGGFGVGDLGPAARSFVNFLSSAGQRIWQVLPLTETDGALGNSPYSSPSAFAGNSLYIGLEDLVDWGFLTPGELENLPTFPEGRAKYTQARRLKGDLFRKAFSSFSPSEEYFAFLKRHGYWLPDYALFSALKNKFGGTPWNLWPDELRSRNNEALRQAKEELRKEIDFLLFIQYLFFSQMTALREKCASAGIELIGDLPIYVNYDSADVWAHPSLFNLDENCLPVEVAGVPPDYFSETGQLWGNPLYDWDALKADDFSWWMERLKHSLSMFHTVRIDHFRGLLAYWAVPYGNETAEKGVWRNVPSEEFFHRLEQNIPSPPFLAENLGVITPDVTEAMRRMNFPGMAVALFAFSGDMKENPHIPHNYVRELTAYSGTHDNNTVRGWFLKDASDEERLTLEAYAGHEITESNVADTVVRLVLSSVADRTVIPLQDYIRLGAEGRMNTPSVPSGNWEWRASSTCFTNELVLRMKKLATLYGRG